MSVSFFKRLYANENRPLPELDSQLALGALMVRVAKADKAYLIEEIGAIDRLLATCFDLNPVEAAKTRATCEKLEKEAPDDEEFIALIRDQVAYDMRVKFYRALFQVMVADGVQKPEEQAVLNRIEVALDLHDLDVKVARRTGEAL